MIRKMIPNSAKLTIARTMFSNGRGIVIYFDGREHQDGRVFAVVPDCARGRLTALRIMPGTPGERVDFDEAGLSATLIFGGIDGRGTTAGSAAGGRGGGIDGRADPESHECLVPWRIVFAIRDDLSLSTVVWPTEFPDDMDELAIYAEHDGRGTPAGSPAGGRGGEINRLARGPARDPVERGERPHLTLVP